MGRNPEMWSHPLADRRESRRRASLGVAVVVAVVLAAASPTTASAAVQQRLRLSVNGTQSFRVVAPNGGWVQAFNFASSNRGRYVGFSLSTGKADSDVLVDLRFGVAGPEALAVVGAFNRKVRLETRRRGEVGRGSVLSLRPGVYWLTLFSSGPTNMELNTNMKVASRGPEPHAGTFVAAGGPIRSAPGIRSQTVSMTLPRATRAVIALQDTSWQGTRAVDYSAACLHSGDHETYCNFADPSGVVDAVNLDASVTTHETLQVTSFLDKLPVNRATVELETAVSGALDGWDGVVLVAS